MELPRLQLLQLSQELDGTEVAALKFLSMEHVPLGKLEAKPAQDFFEVLQEKGLVEAGDMAFLRELLFRIGRIDLLGAVVLNCAKGHVCECDGTVSSLPLPSLPRYLLFQLSEDITRDELKYFKSLLEKELPKSKLNPKTTMLDIFVEMEKKEILGKDNLNILKRLCAEVNPSLLKRIEEYELNLFGEEEMLITEEQGGSTGGSEAQARWLPSSMSSDSPSRWNASSQLEAYKMSSQPRGVCLILNNHSFAKARETVPKLRNMKDRDGTEVDAEALRRVFSQLHFEVAEHKDLTAQQIRETVNSYRCQDHQDRDCFVCCILSHGKRGIIYGVDGQEVAIQELTTSFTGENCRSLAGKPKVFFVQACQGDAFQKGVVVEADSGEQDSSVESDARFQVSCIPSEADFLLGMATLQDYVSYRSPRQGTWYIQALCKHLEYSCPRGEDILTILTAVNQEVSRKGCSANAEKQMPQPSFTLRKKLIFPIN
ncbi:CASP8 protein, partial [Oreotrochilus melanogaster]|nr:CASP8 protein [Oreotrochilus melanogaster]